MENLTPEKWGNAIISGQTPRMIANRVKNGPHVPWFWDILNSARDASGIPNAGYILELGSGTGELSGGLAFNGFKPTLVDFSRTSLDFSIQVFTALNLDITKRAVFSEADVTKRLPFSDNTFDMVFSSGLLEHFNPTEQNHIISESFRITKTSVLTLVPFAGSFPYRLGKYLQEKEGTWKWGKEDPMFTLENIYENLGIYNCCEWTIAPYHALKFLEGAKRQEMANTIKEMYESLEMESLNSLEQGYLLASIAYKNR